MADIIINYELLRLEYDALFARCAIKTEHFATVDKVLDRIVANRARYEAVCENLFKVASRSRPVAKIPWIFVGIIHSLEGSLNFSTHLHNGDPLERPTVHAPKGCPPGSGPFTWEASAAHALGMKSLAALPPGSWTVSRMLFELERYNGWGYRKYHSDVLSAYLWSMTTLYSSGKYVADGKFDRNAVSKQVGGAALLKRAIERQAFSFVEAPVEPVLYTFGVHADGSLLVVELERSGATAFVAKKIRRLGRTVEEVVKLSPAVLSAMVRLGPLELVPPPGGATFAGIPVE